MNRLVMLLILLGLRFFHVKAQSSTSAGQLPSQDEVNFQPSLAVVIGVLCTMFVLTFLLLVFAKVCHRGSTAQQNQAGLIRSTSRFSGIDETVIESLPLFRFSSLKGAREGLECAVCLSKFEDTEILRLLPKCKHAFHIDCVDQWLEKHSSCPLCRYKVTADDLTSFAYSNSLRHLWNQSELQGDSNLELFVQREEDNHGSSRFSIESSFRKTGKGKKDEELPIQESYDSEVNSKKVLHKFNHKIVVSDVVLKNRWSSVSSSDLMLLNSVMLDTVSSNRFSSLDSNGEQSAATKVAEDSPIMKIKEEMERKREFESKVSKFNQSDPLLLSHRKMNPNGTSRLSNSTEKRSMSEITIYPRFTELAMNNNVIGSSIPRNNAEEERVRRLWFSIAQRTVQWFADREKRTRQPQKTRQSQNV